MLCSSIPHIQSNQNLISMAVEAPPLNFFPSQFSNRDFVKMNHGIADMYTSQIGSTLPFAVTMPECFVPALYQAGVGDPVSAKTSVKADSGLTYNVPAVQRKRCRDSMNDELNGFSVTQKNRFCSVSSLLEQNTVFQIQQQQSEIDQLVAEHNEIVRLELDQRRKNQSRILASAIHDRMTKKLKEKDEEIQRIGKLNWILQERVKSLYVENQIWRDLAQSNEAAANSLRSNLEQVLAHVGEDHRGVATAREEDDTESCCGSNDYESKEPLVGGGGSGGGCGGNRMCKKCDDKESCVLLLPCRHLCLCTSCGSALHSCPVCKSAINASVHVNMS